MQLACMAVVATMDAWQNGWTCVQVDVAVHHLAHVMPTAKGKMVAQVAHFPPVQSDVCVSGNVPGCRPG